ncbi:Peptidoglycan-binding Lysin subgroup [Penicillium malachiteum]|uniref:Peptidoglycan-binding Lysin subgroup n=1 Tax=Penicillium malachiteum TaxID=1324776 RepID=A0AAD6HKK0_9EURO|nr:Peptidoglycan-binding Lysin subgroup [Penicillium malachiteum]
MNIFTILTLGSLLEATATASYIPGGALLGRYASLDKRSAPVEDSDGFCYNYTIAEWDTCASIASAYDITTTELENYNTDVWDWYGCDYLYQGAFICLSSGAPPMPVALPHATCGPQVPGTTRPTDMSKSYLASLNPCDNECCSSWGECGTTSHFCDSANCIYDCDKESSSTSTTAAATSTSITSTSTKTSTTSTTSTSTTKTSTSTTKTSTTSKESTTSTTSTKKEETKTSTSTATGPTGTWQVTLYQESDCDAGDEGYFVAGGFNYHTTGDCIRLSGGDLTTSASGPGPYCQWYEDGGMTGPLSCSDSSVTYFNSFIIESGNCQTFTDDACSVDNGEIVNPNSGCQVTKEADWSPTSNTIGSMICEYM